VKIVARLGTAFMAIAVFLAMATPLVAQTYSIPAGSTSSSINSVLSAAATYNGGASLVTVNVAAGVSSIASQITFPCSIKPMVLTGPPTNYPWVSTDRPTAKWLDASSNQIIYMAPCTTARTVEYMELDGNRPSTGGGGIYVDHNSANVSILANYIHGNEEIYPEPCNSGGCAYGMAGSTVTYYSYDDHRANLIELSGSANGTSNSQTNTLIQYNILGNPQQSYPTNQWVGTSTANLGVATSNGDCVNVQQWNFGPGASGNIGFDGTGGDCVGIAIRGGTTDLQILDNIVQNQEQGMKYFECGQTTSTYCYQVRAVNMRNDISAIHRIGLEAQQTAANVAGVQNFKLFYNTFHNPKDPAFGSWVWSIPQGGGATMSVNAESNLGIADCGNAAFPNFCASSKGAPNFFEYWGSNASTANHNLMQVGPSGGIGGGVSWGFGGSSGGANCASGQPSTVCWVANNNTCEGPGIGTNGNPGKCVASEGEQKPPATILPPGIANTIIAATPTQRTANTPSISPASGTFSGSQMVTLTVAQYSSSTSLPQGNMNVWYTTDGTTPAPKGSTSHFYTGPFSVSTTTTVKAVGMWGGVAQPATYTANMGFAPSAPVSATYTQSGGTPTASTPTFTPPTESFTGTISVSAASATSGAVLHCTTDGTTPTTSSPTYTAPFSVSATTTIQCLAVASGYLNSAVGSATYTLTSSTPTLTGGYQGNTGSVNTLAVGAPAVQQVANGTYSDSVTRTLPDAYGNTAVWSSANPAVLQVTSTGLISCLAPSSSTVFSNVKSAPGNVGFSSWGWTCTATAATPVLAPTSQSFSGSLSVSVSDSTPSSTIYCTTDGTTPTTSSPVYSSAFTVTSTTTIKCLGTAFGYNNSAVGSGTYTLVAPTLTGVSITLQGGASFVGVGATVQACANMTYSGVSPTQVCGSGTDAYGTTPSNYTSSAPSFATMTTPAGQLTGVAVGSTNIKVSAGAFTSTFLAVPVTNGSVQPNVTVTGAAKLSGNAIIQ
jgi:hypothetical protein